MLITKNQLRKIIREELIREVDTTQKTALLKALNTFREAIENGKQSLMHIDERSEKSILKLCDQIEYSIKNASTGQWGGE